MAGTAKVTSKVEQFKALREAASKEIADAIAELEQQIEEKRAEGRALGIFTDASPSRSKRSGGQRKCKICGEVGHNSRFHKKEAKAKA